MYEYYSLHEVEKHRATAAYVEHRKEIEEGCFNRRKKREIGTAAAHLHARETERSCCACERERGAAVCSPKPKICICTYYHYAINLFS